MDKAIVDILLVEDNANEVELTLHAFSKHYQGLKIDVVNDGQAAVDYLFYQGHFAARRTPQPGVVLLDLKLPKLDGLEVLERVKSDPHARTVPVVMLTSSKEPRDLEESYRLGVNSYIVKPVDFREFNETVRLVGAYWLSCNTRRPLNVRAAR